MIPKQKVLIGLIAVPAISLGQEIEELEPLTVLARKFDSSKNENASAVGILTRQELDRAQRHRLIDALDLIPGTQSLSTAGLTGNTGTLIIRGLPTNYQQVVVDGVRVADATNGLGNFLANAHVGGVSQLEVLRGPQSVLYGTGAGGGVLGYETKVGEGDPTNTIFGEGGSFGSYRFSLGSEGKVGDLAYGLELGQQFTENDTYTALSRHDYRQDSANLALEWQVSDDLRFKLSYRGGENLLKTTATGFGSTSNSEIETDTHLLALNTYYQVNPGWKTRFTAGYYDEVYDGSFGGSIFASNYDRITANWNNEIELSDELKLVTGLEYAHSDYENSTGREVSYANVGAYANVFYRPVGALLLEAGIRYDDHDEFGGDVAWNVGAVYEVNDTRFHARFSQAYRNPTLLNSEEFVGFFSTQRANPNLDSEEIQGFEVGVEQALGDHKIGLNFYSQELENAIVSETLSPGVSRQINSLGSSRVSGFELSSEGRLVDDRVRYRLAWTLQKKEEVIDLPDSIVSADLSYQAEKWLIGVGASYADGATYVGFGGVPETDSRVLTRLYGKYDLNENVSFHARVENLFDEDHLLFADVFGGGAIRGSGRSFSVGASVKF